MDPSGKPQLILASASRARRSLLVSAGFSPFVIPSQFDESQIPLSDPPSYVKILAQRKAETVAEQFPAALVLGCDSVLAFNGQIYGKPQDKAEAITRWQAMTGQVGQLYTGHALIPPEGPALMRCAVTQVHFSAIDQPTIEAYVNSEEPLNCAGAFAIDGRGGLLVDKLEGCHSNVIGLSLPLFREMLEELGYRAIDFWSV